MGKGRIPGSAWGRVRTAAVQFGVFLCLLALGPAPFNIDSCSGAADGTFACDPTVPGTVTLNLGDPVVGTATDGAQNTSEFGANFSAMALSIVKRAFQLDGTPIPSGSTLPKGMPVRFMLYVNNPGATVMDVSMQDVLDPLFAYLPGSFKFANTQANCVLPVCDTSEEAAVFASAVAGSTAMDSVTAADPIAIVGSTVHVGNQTVGQKPLTLLAGKVWAVIFTVTIQ